jgi:hypothetical protein
MAKAGSVNAYEGGFNMNSELAQVQAWWIMASAAVAAYGNV